MLDGVGLVCFVPASHPGNTTRLAQTAMDRGAREFTRGAVTFLLDVNLLIALLDPTHTSHDRAHDWFGNRGSQSWATCPITENGTIRIIGHQRYPNSPGSPAVVAGVVQRLRLLALAKAHGGMLATLDRRLSASGVPHGSAVLHLV